MSILRKLRFEVLSVSLAALTGCASLGAAISPLPSEQAGMVREACGLIPSNSQMKSSADMRRRAYLECKRQVLGKDATDKPVS